MFDHRIAEYDGVGPISVRQGTAVPFNDVYAMIWKLLFLRPGIGLQVETFDQRDILRSARPRMRVAAHIQDMIAGSGSDDGSELSKAPHPPDLEDRPIDIG